MPIKAFLAAVLGLSFLAPWGTPAAAQSPADARAFHLAQADQKAEEPKAKEEDESRRKSRRPEGGDAKGKDAAKDATKDAPKEATKDAAKDSAKGAPDKGRDAAAPAPKGPAPRQETKSDPAPQRGPERVQERTGGAGKTKQEAGAADKQRQQEAAEKAAREAKAAEDAAKAKAAQQKAAPEQSKQLAPQPQQTQDRDRGKQGPSADRPRRGEDSERAQSRSKEREAKKTSSQELSRTQVRGDKPAVIDGGARTLRRDGNRVVIRGNDFDRLRGGQGNQRVERLPNNQTRTIVVYPDGSQIVTVTGPRGEILHRSRRDRNGREIVLIRDTRRAPVVQINLGPLRITIPREQYIVDSRRASRGDLYAALIAPPVERLTRVYSLEEVRSFDRVRDTMRRIDISTITFDTDSAIITPDQVGELAELAGVLNELIDRNPGETFLIEGHTDLVGSEIHNLALSDRRAEAVAIALTDYFDVPPENIVTQGYGEAFPKIPTELAERENRRVALRRLTLLVGGK